MPAITAVRTAVAQRRVARARRRQLERDLAGFATPAQRLDLDAMLSRYPSEQTEDIRRILAAQDAAKASMVRTGSGGHLAA